MHSLHYGSTRLCLWKEKAIHSFTLMLLVTNLVNTKWCKNLKNDWNPCTWVLIWECSARYIEWIPTCQGLDCYQKSLRPCALDESSLSIGRVNARFTILYKVYADKKNFDNSLQYISRQNHSLERLTYSVCLVSYSLYLFLSSTCLTNS